MKSRSLLLIVCMTAAVVTRPALGDTAGDKAAAEALFEQGKKLLEQGKFEEACDNLEASQRLDSGLGTLLYLADCYEQAGRTASAWATFREAASLARGRGDKARADVAAERANRLEPRLSKLWLEVAADTPPDLTITRDGSPIPQETWSLAIPIDPGQHEIVASAPGKETWTTTVSVEGDGSNTTLEVPSLTNLPAASSPPPTVEPGGKPAVPVDTASSDGSGQRVAGLVVGGAGVVGVVIGSVFGLVAIDTNDESLEQCDPDDPGRCTEEGKDLRDDAAQAATISTVAFGVGAAALATGVVLYLTAPSGDTTAARDRLQLRTTATPQSTGVTLKGTF